MIQQSLRHMMFIKSRPPLGLPILEVRFLKLQTKCWLQTPVSPKNTFKKKKKIVFSIKTQLVTLSIKTTAALLMCSWRTLSMERLLLKVFVCGLPDDSCSVLPAQISASKTASLLSRATVHCCYYIKPGTEQHGYKTGLLHRPMVSFNSFHCANNHL